ncbi:MAG: ATP-binding protein [Planctomycetota bacterium]
MKYRESEIVELKKSTSELKEAVISIAAMLNKHGKGTVCFGVRNDGVAIGQPIGSDTLRTVSQAIAGHVEPQIYPTVQGLKIQGKDCIIVKCEGRSAPYFAYGRAYMRVADEDRQLSVGELARLMAERNPFASPWESAISDVPVAKASAKTVRQFVKKANEAGRIAYRYNDLKNVLKKLGLVSGGKLLNAGKALFTNEPMMEVQAAVFAGVDKVTFLDIQSFRGNLFDLARRSEQYVKEHINWRAEITGFKREEIPEVPVAAFREAVINSLCHREFSNPKGNEVAIFKDRIEIYNPGNFPEGHTPEEFIRGEERSLLRNPAIANAFYLASDIERWGSGLKRIDQACRAAGVRVDFKNIKTGFLVVLHRPKAGGEKISAGEKGREKSREKSREKILGLAIANPCITLREMAEILSMSHAGIEKVVRRLKGEGRLKRIGPDKGGRWEVLSSKQGLGS